MNRPREADIEAAKAYLRQRIEYEQAMTTLLESAMKEAAEKIVEICYSARINPQAFRYSDLPVRVQYQIDDIIRQLQSDIDDYFQTFAIADHEENRDKILPFILGEQNGSTFGERLSDYCDKYRDELMLLIGAALFLGVGKMALVKSIGNNLKHPYANQLLADGIEAPLSYGRGRTNSMFTAIGDLTRYGIAEAWMRNQYINNRKNGCIGWHVQRGSGYPCELCDSMTGFHADENELPPYHSHCCCFAVPIYLE